MSLANKRRFTLLNIFYFFLLITVLCCFLFVIQIVHGFGPKDFCQDYDSAKLFLQHTDMYAPINCFDTQTKLTLRYNLHPPVSVLLFLPLTFFSVATASYIWLIFSLFCYFLSGFLLLKYLKIFTLKTLLLFMTVSLIWVPFLLSTFFQNVGQLLLLLITFALYFQHKYPKISGVCLGIAALLKIWPIVLLFGLFITNKKQSALYGCICFCVGIIISILIFGLHPYASYLGPVRQYESFWIAFSYNYSLTSFFAKYFIGFLSLSQQSVIYLGEIISIVLLIASLLFVWWYSKKVKKYGDMLTYCFLLSVTFLIFPISWNWGLLIFLIAYAALVKTMQHNKQHIPCSLRIWCIIVSLFMLDITWIVTRFIQTHTYSPLLYQVGTALETLLIGAFILLQITILLRLKNLQ